MTNDEFQELVNNLFTKHATRCGQYSTEGDLVPMLMAVDEYDILNFANDLKEILEKQKN